MDYLGRTLDNTHQGNTEILKGLAGGEEGNLKVEGDLLVEGDVALDNVIVNDLEVVNELKVDGYTLPTSAGTEGQVITMQSDGKTTAFEDPGGAGTAGLKQTLYKMSKRNFYPTDGNFHDLVDISGGDSAPFGSNVVIWDDLHPDGAISFEAEGYFSVDNTNDRVKFRFFCGLNNNVSPTFFYDSQLISLTKTSYQGQAPESSTDPYDTRVAWKWRFKFVVQKRQSGSNPDLFYQFQSGSIIFRNGSGTLTEEALEFSNVVVVPNIKLPGFSTNDTGGFWQNLPPSPGSGFYLAGATTSVGTNTRIVPTSIEINYFNPGTEILTSTAAPATNHLTLANLNGNGGDGGHVFLFDKRGIKPMDGNLNMNSNSITNLQNIDTNNQPLNILSGSSFPQLNLTGGINCNDSAFLYSCPSIYAGTTNLVLGSDTLGTEIQTGPFGSRQTEMIILPNLINVNSAITNFVGGDVYMSQNRIQDLKRVDGGGAGSNFIEMVDATLLNAMRIESNVGILLQETTTSNRIGVNNGGLASQVASGGTIIQNTDAGNDLILSKTNGGKIFLQNTATGGIIEAEAEQIDINYTTNNFKVRNGLNNSFVIDGTDTESFLNFKCPSINSLTPVGGLSSGTSNSSILSASTAEQSILANTFVGSRQAPANSFQQGDAYTATLAGNFSSNNGDTLTLRLKGGATGTTILSSIVVPLNGSSGVFFELEINFCIRQIGTTGLADLAVNYDFSYNQSAGGNFQGERKCEFNNTTFDTTILNQLDITAQFSSTNANNSIETILSTLGKTY